MAVVSQHTDRRDIEHEAGGDPQVRADPGRPDSPKDMPVRESDRAASGLARQGDELLGA
jgi:hypothetical protein